MFISEKVWHLTCVKADSRSRSNWTDFTDPESITLWLSLAPGETPTIAMLCKGNSCTADWRSFHVNESGLTSKVIRLLSTVINAVEYRPENIATSVVKYAGWLGIYTTTKVAIANPAVIVDARETNSHLRLIVPYQSVFLSQWIALQFGWWLRRFLQTLVRLVSVVLTERCFQLKEGEGETFKQILYWHSMSCIQLSRYRSRPH